MLRQLVAQASEAGSPELWDPTDLMGIMHEGKRYVVVGGTWCEQRNRQRRESRLAKAEAELQQLAAVQRKKANPQNLASQVGQALQRLYAHKYYH